MEHSKRFSISQEHIIPMSKTELTERQAAKYKTASHRDCNSKRQADIQWVPYSAGIEKMPSNQRQYVLELRVNVRKFQGWELIKWQPLGSPIVMRECRQWWLQL